MKRYSSPRTLRRWTCAWCVVLIGLFVGLPLQAAPKKKEDPNYRQVQYRKAHDAMQAKQWDEARLLLFDLWRRARTYDVAASLGQAEYWLKNYGAGARYIVFALEHLPPGENADTVRRLNAGLEELKKHVGAFEVVVDEPGAEIVLDSEIVGHAPLASVVYVDPGPHRLEARSPGKPPVEVKLDAALGQTYKVELRTETPRATAAAETTAAPSKTPAAPATAAVAAERGPMVERSRSLVPLLVTGGVALAGAGTGVAFTLFANDRSARIEELGARVGPGGCRNVQSAACDELADNVERRDRERNLAVASFVTGGVAAATSVLYLLFPKARAREAKVRVMMEPGGALLHVGGRL